LEQLTVNLYAHFLSNTGLSMIKNTHYFPIYERHFAPWVGRPVTMLEIGTGEGGSSKMWKMYFGPYARIVSIDIRSGCAALAEEQIFVRIGDQSDRKFLSSVLAEFGPPDIVMDDGSHIMEHVFASFDFIYPRMGPYGVYLVEDLNTAYWPSRGGGLRAAGSFIERAKGLVDELNARHTEGVQPETTFSRTTTSIHFYDMVVVFERAPYLNRELLTIPAQSS
jgi:cephalosporin hydroxylase